MRLLARNIQTPKLIISARANLKMHQLVEQSPKEIGWHGLIEKTGDYEFTLKDILLFPQYVTGATVTPDEEEYANWLNTQANEHLEDFNKIRFHGHSHVNMSTKSSGVDDRYRDDLVSLMTPEDENPFYIFLIMNKKDEYTLEFYDIEKGIIFDNNEIDVTWELPNILTRVQNWANNMIKINVKEKKYPCSTTSKVSNSSTPKTAKEQLTLSEREPLAERYQSYWRDWD